MKRFLNEIIPLILCSLIIGGSIGILMFYVKDYPSENLTDWANFATYLSVSLSLISVFFIYLTYRNQVRMSSVLQFESTFFQWYQLHNELLRDLKPQIDESVSRQILQRLEESDFKDLSVFEELAQKEISRPLHRYYRSMYHLFKYIKLSPILSNNEQRKKYYDIIQSNMSDNELVIFLCFVLGDVNRDKAVFGTFNRQSFKDLIDEGHIMKNCYVPNEELLIRMTPLVRACFPKTAVKSFHFFTSEIMEEALRRGFKYEAGELKR